MTTRKTLKDFLTNQLGVTQDSISYNIDSGGDPIQEGDDLGVDPGLNKPFLGLDDESAGLLGDYLSFIVDQSSNEFKIKPGNERAAPTGRGDALVTPDEQGAENVFTPQGSEGYTQLNMYSDSTKHYSEEHTLQDIVDKTGAPGTARLNLQDIEGKVGNSYGETLVNPAGEDNIIVKSTQNILKNYNRFSNTIDGDAFVPKNTSVKDLERPSSPTKTGTVTSQIKLGHFEKNINRVTLSNLKEIGASLLLKSTGFDSGDSPGNSAGAGDLESDIKNSDSVVANNFSEEGYTKRDVTTLRAMNAKGFPTHGKLGRSTREGKGYIIPSEPDANNVKSFGATYNPAMPFTSPNSKIAKIQTAATVVALIKTTKSFLDTVQSLSGLKFQSNAGSERSSMEVKYDGPGPHAYGRYRPSISDKVDFVRKTLLSDTIYPYNDCVESGLVVFFGKENENVDKVSLTDNIGQNDGFWMAIASSIMKSLSDAQGSLFGSLNAAQVDFTPENIAATLRALKTSKVLGFMNVCAIIGDMYLRRSGGSKNYNKFQDAVGVFDVDSLPDGPGTRVSKSRAANGRSPLTLAWESNSVPSMYMLPKNIVRTVTRMSTLTVGTNPLKGLLGTELINNTYLDKSQDGSFNRIPEDVVKRLEDRLDAEYVPFYIQDLRTNEIIAFHAFLNKLTDAIKPSYDAVSGYGRMDPVQIYKGTTRTVSVGFTLISTSREDYDMMWYKINKLTTLFYPQWTQGTKVVSGQNKFTQPFSQVLGASPIVRMRVGDVIKSNYSKFNLSRIFGIGDEDTVIQKVQEVGSLAGGVTEGRGIFNKGQNRRLKLSQKLNTNLEDLGMTIFYLAYGSPMQFTANMKNEVGRKTAENLLSNFLYNGFVNPLMASRIGSTLSSPDQSLIKAAPGMNIASLGDFLVPDPKGFGKLSIHFLKPTSKGYKCIDDGKTYNLMRSIRILIGKKQNIGDPTAIPSKNPYVKDFNYKEMKRSDFNAARTAYEVQVIDFAAPANLFMKKFLVYHEDLLANPSSMFNRFVLPTFLSVTAAAGLIQNVAREAAIAAGVGTEAVDAGADKLMSSKSKQFMLSENNPIVRAYDTTKGRGLAGVLDGVTFNWLDDSFAWETDWNARAPKGVSIDLNLNVIHDIPPGMDHSGFNRAPLYNVGEIMRHVAGDPHDDDGLGSEFAYKNAARSGFRATKIKGE
jgi:hypothetical protein